MFGGPLASAPSIAKLPAPLYGTTWNSNILNIITTDRITKLMHRLRNLNLKQSEYGRLPDFFRQAYQADPVFPPDLRAWQVLADRFRLYEPRGWPMVLAEAAFLEGRGISPPIILADVRPAGLGALYGTAEFSALVRAFWGVARTTFSPPASSARYMFPPGQGVGALALTMAVKKRASQFAKTGKLRIRLSKQQKQKRPSATLGPMRTIAHLRKGRLLPYVLDRFCSDAARKNLLKRARAAPPA